MVSKHFRLHRGGGDILHFRYGAAVVDLRKATVNLVRPLTWRTSPMAKSSMVLLYREEYVWPSIHPV